MKLLVKLACYFVFFLLCISNISFAYTSSSDDCSIDFKAFEQDLLNHIPSSYIYFHRTDKVNGEILLKVKESQLISVNYAACHNMTIKISAASVHPDHINFISELIDPLIAEAAFSMKGIIKNLRSYMATKNLTLNVHDQYFSKMKIQTIHNNDESINIEIEATGE